MDFYHSDPLAKHCLDVHEGRKIFHCSLCNHTTADEFEMFSHLSSHEEVPSFKSIKWPQNQMETYLPESNIQNVI